MVTSANFTSPPNVDNPWKINYYYVHGVVFERSGRMQAGIQFKSKRRYIKWGVFMTLIYVFLFVLFCSKPIEAAEISDEFSANDSQVWRFLGEHTEGFEGNSADGISLYNARGGGNKYTGITYVHNEAFDSDVRFNGIDVSHWNGDIDWKKVKADGIDFALIRVGHREAKDGSITEDRKYKENIEQATAAGVMVGVYIYSQAITPEEAVEEANYILSRISGYNMALPVVIDYEYGYYKVNGVDVNGRLLNANLSREAATEICNTFCAKVKSAGYIPMVYANKHMLMENLNADDISSKYKIWLARWNNNSEYNGKYEFWQYTDKGIVDGIQGYVDCDFWYCGDYTPVFNAKYYLATYPDLARAYGNDEVKAFQHFINQGMDEGRRGNQTFDVYSYRGRYADLQRAYGTDIKRYYMHYLQQGIRENRNGSLNSASYTVTFDCGGGVIKTQKVMFGHAASLPSVNKSGGTMLGWSGDYSCVTSDRTVTASWSFVYQGVDYGSVYDVDYYLGKNADLRSAFGSNGIAALQHFVNHGMSEGRQAKDSFSVVSYKNLYPDLRQAYGTDLRRYYRHYIERGKREGRRTTGYENVVVGGVTVYNGIDYSAVYDCNYYVTRYADLYRAFGYNDLALLRHFVNCGMQEGRQAKDNFNVLAYKNRYVDLQSAYGNDLKSYYLHYINRGRREGRNAL